ncbi:NAD-dependent epimerase/dehydratase family protein [Luteimonas sp. FXH3W]|uniref:NAD-dependent epimerase/dehydratase family protein n=1 Tax=Aquilutibacter rugosus TaxID=3115820 RepID=A0ABU7UXR8_9GAMM
MTEQVEIVKRSDSSLITVVGGSGFIGTRLCEIFEKNLIPFRIVDKNVSAAFPDSTTVADVTNYSQLRAALVGCDVIINLAAEHRDDVKPVSRYDAVNVDGARNVCRAASELDIRQILFTSTVAVYGFAPSNTGESGEILPFNDYGRTKAKAEEVFRSWQLESPSDRSVVIVRPTVVFGERNRGNVFNLLKQVACGAFAMIGDGKNRKSMAYVGNVAAFLQHMLGAGPGVHVSNYVDKPDFDMNALVDLARASLGRRKRMLPRIPYSVGYALGGLFDVTAVVIRRPLPISRIRVKKFCATTQFDSAYATFGFTPPYTLEEGLTRTLQFEFGSAPVGGPLFYSE